MPLTELVLICVNITETSLIQKLIHIVESGSGMGYMNVST
jgi:hypothetical protein